MYIHVITLVPSVLFGFVIYLKLFPFTRNDIVLLVTLMAEVDRVLFTSQHLIAAGLQPLLSRWLHKRQAISEPHVQGTW
jgi:hypothetical protein